MLLNLVQVQLAAKVSEQQDMFFGEKGLQRSSVENMDHPVHHRNGSKGPDFRYLFCNLIHVKQLSIPIEI